MARKLSSGVLYLRPGASDFQRFFLPLPPQARVLVPFWNAETPPASSLEIGFELDGKESFTAAIWGSSPFQGSFKKRESPLCRWEADSLTLKAKPGRIQLTASLSGKARLTLLGVTWRSRSPLPLRERVRVRGKTGWNLEANQSPHPNLPPQGGKELSVPSYSQRQAPSSIAGRICSPTSLAMAVAGLSGRKVDYGTWAAEILDRGADLYGNWSFGCAAAAELLRRRGKNLACHPRFFSSLAECLPFLERGTPVILSIRFEKGELPGSPLRRTSGHLVLLRSLSQGERVRVRGTSRLEALVHDPAGKNTQEVPRVYDAAALDRAWQKSGRLGYVFTEEKSVPSS